MRIAVTGASGLVGSVLCSRLASEGVEVLRLVRRPPGPGEVFWDSSEGVLDEKALEGTDAVVHLAGESIAARRWSPEFKGRIRASRVEGTGLLARTLARVKKTPAVFLCASAVGFYGDRGDEVLTEESSAGSGFLAEVCQEWEGAAEPARSAGIRTVHLRLGTVLSYRGGALVKMLPAFRMGMGGRIGSGRQWMSWISLDDAVGAAVHLLSHDLSGPINGTSPNPVANREFTKSLSRVLHRPAVLPLPATAVRLAFGEMGESLLIGSCRALPARLQASGFQFAEPLLEGALRRELGQSS